MSRPVPAPPLLRDMVFVFGSNLAGRHGKGAALYARQHFGAKTGVGEGLTGRAYAIPTKDANLRTLPLDAIAESYARFIAVVHERPAWAFYLTPFGTGLAGHSLESIRSIVRGHPLPRNVFLAPDWVTARQTAGDAA